MLLKICLLIPYLFAYLLAQPNSPKLAWEFSTIEDDMGNPRTQIYLLVNDQKHEIGKGVGNFSELEKSQYTNSQYQIPASALSACAGFWAGLGHQLWVTQKGKVLLVKEGFLEAESRRGTKVIYKTIKKINL
ncbi:MAG: hypothetical protein MUE85_23020 [Microscillaceae bacterium]|jgi:hypothetical protein|nr:hypothetical protein [Microscillaceae bacterium]